MKVTNSLLLLTALAVLSQIESRSPILKCPKCEIMDCLYGLHPDAYKPGVCECTCRPCPNTCDNCKYGVLKLKDGCPDCSACCPNPCDRKPCKGDSVCVPNKYPSPFSPICGVRYTCLEKEHPVFNCKDLKCKENEKCVDGVPEMNKPAQCEPKQMCPMKKCKPCISGYKIDEDGCRSCECCPGVMCMMFCQEGFAKGKDGCPICKCNKPGPPGPPTPPPTCAGVDCPNGQVCKVLPDKNCGIHSRCQMVAQCVVEKPGPICGPTCKIACEYGNVLDSKGCPTCKCNDKPYNCKNLRCPKDKDCVEDDIVCVKEPCDKNPRCAPCPPVCDIFCPNGNVLDKNRCPTCTCIEKPNNCEELKCGREQKCVEDDIVCVTEPCNRNPRCEQCPLVCDIHCPNGHVKDKDGCPTCTCIEKPKCPPVCKIFCRFGNVKDKNGCPTCTCNDKPYNCEQLRCRNDQKCVEDDIECVTEPCNRNPRCEPKCPPVCAIFCPFGNVPDKNGCPTCTCNEKPYNCKQLKCDIGLKCVEDDIQCVTEPCDRNPRCESCPPVCANFCPHGRVADKDGCPSCTCIEKPECPPVCEMFCPHGNEVDENGCPICSCKKAPKPMNCGELKCGTGEVCIEDNIQCVTEPCNRNPRCELRDCERCQSNEECVFETVLCKKNPCPKFAKCVPNELCKKCKPYEKCDIVRPICIPGMICPKQKAVCTLKNPCIAVRCGFGQFCVSRPSKDCKKDDPNCPKTGVCVNPEETCAAKTCPMNHHCEEKDGKATCIPDPLCVKAGCEKDQECVIITPGCTATGDCPSPTAECVPVDPCSIVRCGFGQFCISRPSKDCKKDDPNCPKTAVCVNPEETCAAKSCPMNHYCEEKDGKATCVPDPLCVKAGCKKDQECVIITPGCTATGDCPSPKADCVPVNPCRYHKCGFAEICVVKREDCSTNKLNCKSIAVCEKPKPTCAAMLCPVNHVCEENDEGAKCRPCPVFRCMACPDGEEHVRDKAGCPSCECKPKMETCDDIKCKKDEHCEMSVTCFGLNCPPSRPICVKNQKTECDRYKCPHRKYCEMSIVCMAIGCPPSVPICSDCPVYRCKACADNEYNIPDPDTGCPSCNCAPKKVCPAIKCDSFCKNGHVIENGCQTCKCNPPPPPPTCQNFRCSDPDTECQLIPTPCAPPPEPCRMSGKECVYYCHPEPVCVKKQKVDCSTVKCRPGTKCEMKTAPCLVPPCPEHPVCVQEHFGTCASTTCVEGEVCEMVPVPCFNAPCPEMPRCIRKTITCDNIECTPGEKCIMQQAICKKAPCPQKPVCIADHFPTCASALCPRGQVCFMREVQCITAPCPPAPTCVDLCKELNCREDERCDISFPKCFGSAKCNAQPEASCVQKNPCALIDCEEGKICLNGRCICPEIPCRTKCEYGYQVGSHGCKICKCNEKPVCPPLNCRMNCPYGLLRGSDGCDRCKCKPSPACENVRCGRNQECQEGKCVCKPQLCELYCKNGFRKDENGCEDCACNPDNSCQTVKCSKNQECEGGRCICKPVMCRLFCPTGWAKDERDGCEICKCNPPPSPICKERCTENQACVNGECKCKPVLCKMFCEGGWARGKDGCEICKCKPPTCKQECSKNQICRNGKCVCKPVLCRMKCQFGWAVDKADNCKICKCGPAPPPSDCTKPVCPENCANSRIVRNKKGCEQCICLHVKSPGFAEASRQNCPNIDQQCNLECPFGNAVDHKGCKICDCAKPLSSSCDASNCYPGETCRDEVSCDGDVCETQRYCEMSLGMFMNRRKINM